MLPFLTGILHLSGMGSFCSMCSRYCWTLRRLRGLHRCPSLCWPVVPPSNPVGVGDLGSALGLLQSDILTQLISATIAGVAPITKATFLGQQSSGGGGNSAASSASLKQKEVVHSLPWGAPCGSSSGGSTSGTGAESSLSSGHCDAPE